MSDLGEGLNECGIKCHRATVGQAVTTYVKQGKCCIKNCRRTRQYTHTKIMIFRKVKRIRSCRWLSQACPSSIHSFVCTLEHLFIASHQIPFPDYVFFTWKSQFSGWVLHLAWRHLTIHAVVCVCACPSLSAVYLRRDDKTRFLVISSAPRAADDSGVTFKVDT